MKTTYIVSVDAESNGLGGEVFAVGAVLVEVRTDTPAGARRERWYGAIDCPAPVNLWVKENVLPHLLYRTHGTQQQMLESFWLWLDRTLERTKATILVDVGFPVEARLICDLLRPDPERAWKLNAPVLDLASLLVAHGFDGFNVPRESWAREQFGEVRWSAHNPTDDAEMAAGAFLALARRKPEILTSPSFRAFDSPGEARS